VIPHCSILLRRKNGKLQSLERSHFRDIAWQNDQLVNEQKVKMVRRVETDDVARPARS
jgi:hypothetical protein